MSDRPRFNVSLYTLLKAATYHVAISDCELSFICSWLECHRSRTVNPNLNDKAIQRLDWFATRFEVEVYIPERHLNRFYEQVEANAGGADCLKEPVASTVRHMKAAERRRLRGDQIQRIRRQQLQVGG